MQENDEIIDLYRKSVYFTSLTVSSGDIKKSSVSEENKSSENDKLICWNRVHTGKFE